ncbi:MAG TPA: hypothetical protein VF173_27295 [Thermoanaerobaculia bacterium]|nr:hypothetical protein [Thermoanaerobaculia bacterium]
MSKSNRNANDLKEWGETTTAIVANAAELPQTEMPRVALEKLTEELRQLVVGQNLAQATKLQTTQRMAEIHSEGAKLATILRFMIKQHFGNTSDKLVEFGVKPFRGGRPRKAVPTEVPPPVPGHAPAIPATTATPDTK